MKALGININSWEILATNRTSWRSTLQKQLQTGEEKLSAAAAEKRAGKKRDSEQTQSQHPYATYVVVTVTLALVSTGTTRCCSSRADSLDL